MCKTDAIKTLLTEAFLFAKQAFQRCFDDLGSGKPADKTSALALAAMCASRYTDAASIYLLNPDIEDDTIPELLRQFHRVTNEVWNVYQSSKHNNTALFIEFDYLKELLINNGYPVK